MSDRLAAMVELMNARALLDDRRARDLEPALTDETFFGLDLRPGDRVRDKVTGGIGNVERVQSRHLVIPPA